MLNRTRQMNLNISYSIRIIGFSKSRNKEWHNNYDFLTWEYGKYHLKKSDMDRLHRCKFVLGGNCEHRDKENSCIKCLTCLSFFKIFFCLSWKCSMKKYLQITRMRLQPWWLRRKSYHMRFHTIIYIVYVQKCSFML